MRALTPSLQAPNQMTHIAHTKPIPEPGRVHKPSQAHGHLKFVEYLEANAANGRLNGRTQDVVESSIHQEQDM